MANCYFAKPDSMRYSPFLHVIDFKGALSFDEAQATIAITACLRFGSAT